ncbi:hypothetical protein EGW35_10840 [Enterococcus durans]|nr:hypothetical protein CUM72_04900 [Enterococcus durans]ROX81569.1 hypothetical protein EGW35_10840 [Enterococcus durans]TKN17919.1 hypothetical protein DVW83_07225 [Enterococcus sp. VV15]
MSTNKNIKIKEKSIDKMIKQILKTMVRKTMLRQKCFLLLSHARFLKFTKKLTFGRRLFECL